MVRSKWKAPFVDHQLLNKIDKNKDRSVIETKSRSSIILQAYTSFYISVYTGRSFIDVFIEERMVGRKLGEFAFTRRIGEKKIKKVKITRVKKQV